jgi:hypothetical protein
LNRQAMRRWGGYDWESSDGRDFTHLDVDDSVSLILGHLCANDFESEVICEPIVRWQLINVLFTSCAVEHC